MITDLNLDSGPGARVNAPLTSAKWNVIYRSSIPCLSGTVIRTSVMRMMETEREFVCTKCRQTFSVSADFEQFYTIPKPTRYINSMVCLWGWGGGGGQL